MKVTKKTKINKLIEEHPQAADILVSYGLGCVGCVFSEFDTLENGALIHGMDKEEIEMIIKDINKIVKKN